MIQTKITSSENTNKIRFDDEDYLNYFGICDLLGNHGNAIHGHLVDGNLIDGAASGYIFLDEPITVLREVLAHKFLKINRTNLGTAYKEVLKNKILGKPVTVDFFPSCGFFSIYKSHLSNDARLRLIPSENCYINGTKPFITNKWCKNIGILESDIDKDPNEKVYLFHKTSDPDQDWSTRINRHLYFREKEALHAFNTYIHNGQVLNELQPDKVYKNGQIKVGPIERKTTDHRNSPTPDTLGLGMAAAIQLYKDTFTEDKQPSDPQIFKSIRKRFPNVRGLSNTTMKKSLGTARKTLGISED